MTSPLPFNPEWTREALIAGFDHEAVPYEESRIESGIAQSRHGGPQGLELLPHQSLLKAYFTARAYATAKRSQKQDNPGSVADWFQQGFNAWLKEIAEDSPNSNATPAFPRHQEIQPGDTPPDFGTELNEALLYAIISGYVDEGVTKPVGEEQTMRVPLPNLGPNPPAYALLITAYFQSRAAAIAERLERDPVEELDRWFSQAALNYMNEVIDNTQSEQYKDR